MNTRDFLLYTIATFLGTMAALAIVALVAKVQAQKALADAQQTQTGKLFNLIAGF